MVPRISRRQLLALLSAMPAVHAWAQASSAPVIGFLSGGSPYEWAPFVAAFRAGLSEMGYREGRNLTIEFRWALSDRKNVPALAQDLANRHLDVVVASGGFTILDAIMQAISTTPIVAVFGGDPVHANGIASSARPGGRITGVSLASLELEIRRLEIVREIVPGVTKIGFIAFPKIPVDPELRKYFEDGARQLGLDRIIVPADNEAEIEDAFLKFSQARVGAVEIASTAYYLDRRDRLAALAARHKLPAIYPARAYVDAGGLVSYGVDRLETYMQLGRYVGRVLHGESPADMPVLQPTKFELAINTKAAKALGLTIPQSLLTLADAVIQ